MSEAIAALVDGLSWACLSAGAIFCVIGGIGLLRLPDVYARTHGASITDTIGAGLILLGLVLQAGLTLTAVKLLMVLLFMFFTGPTAGHALVKAAYAHGIKAWTAELQREPEGTSANEHDV